MKLSTIILSIITCSLPMKFEAQDYKASVPIVFHPKYDISFFGIENLHPFDSKKYSKIWKHLQKTFNLQLSDIYQPNEIQQDELLSIHSNDYLASLKKSNVTARITEIPFCAYDSTAFLQSSTHSFTW